MDTVLRVEKLGKKYNVRHQAAAEYSTLRDDIALAAKSLVRRKRKSSAEEFWALRDVDIEVRQGERLGVIGRNGAGKSTLLKIISRITDPSAGRAIITGRVASLLEVGTGFHQELSGRENIFLNGAILGMSRSEIRAKFDEIVAFAEIERFLDTPVKRYSSGMYVRLAFAVAAHIEPDILLVDEVLAVGDATFQRKCLARMGDVAREGRTILFVSHNMAAVQTLCDRAIRFDGGMVVDSGDSSNVVTRYMRESCSNLTSQSWGSIDSAPGNEYVRLRRASVRPAFGSDITVQTPLDIEFEFVNLEPGAQLNLSLHIYNDRGVLVCNPASNDADDPTRGFASGLYRSVCHVPGELLNDGMYKIELLIVKDAGNVIYKHEDILVFDVLDCSDERCEWFGKRPGVVRPNLAWNTYEISRDTQCGTRL